MADNERRIYQITCQPGISRDGTALDSLSYVDGQWVRFQKGRPKKIGGWKEISGKITSIVRGANTSSADGFNYIYGFARNKVWSAVTGESINSSSVTSTTIPILDPEDNYTFQSDSIFDVTGTGISKLIFHGATNVVNIDNADNTPVYSLTQNTNPFSVSAVDDGNGGRVEVSGGVVVLQPYVFAYGNDGLIKNSVSNNPDDWRVTVSNDANEVNVAGSKIVKGMALRSGVNSPAGLFWSLDSLIRVSKVGAEFQYDTISSQTSILSPHSTVEYDGVYYWLGTDRFLAFDGNVREIPNTQNLNWFFDNLNYRQRTKVWGSRNTRYGEIWWHFPFGDAEECTHAIIYNIRENCWYDTRHPRSYGVGARVLRHPISFGCTDSGDGNYSVFAEEFGVDAVEGGRQLAIPSHFETCDFGYIAGGAAQKAVSGNDFWTRLIRVEPDFVQSGDIRMTVKGWEFASSSPTESEVHVITPDTELVDLREQKRIIRLRFESNEISGNFHMGRVILHTETGDARS